MQSIPRNLPPLELLIDDLGGNVAKIAAFLNVTPRQLKSWMKKGIAPRAHMLALYFVSRWGRDFLTCGETNRASNFYSQLETERHYWQIERRHYKQRIANAYLQGSIAGSFAPESVSWARDTLQPEHGATRPIPRVSPFLIH